MIIEGKVHCFFEQSGTFKNEFKKLGIDAYDYDIQNNFGQTDYVIDLFSEIERAYDHKPSVFDNIGGVDLIMAFFPCIYFCDSSSIAMSMNYLNYRALTLREKVDKILDRAKNREYYDSLIIKLFAVVMARGLKMVVENPYSPMHYLHANFILSPTFVDHNRQLRGDYFMRPTQYWFVGFNPTTGCTMRNNPIKRKVKKSKCGNKAGVCSMERSMIAPEYAKNFICDFILGKEISGTQRQLFGEEN